MGIFGKSSEEKMIEAQQEQINTDANRSLSAQLMTGQCAAMDTHAQLERREVLVQLSQWQQDRSEAMQKLFLKLCGYKYNKDNNILEKVKWDVGYVTVIGAQKLVNFIEPLDRNVMLANWDTKMLLKTMRIAIAHPIRNYIFQNHDELDLTIEHADYIFWLIVNTVEPTYWRGWNDGERRKDKEMIKIQEIRNPLYQQKKKGIFGMEA